MSTDWGKIRVYAKAQARYGTTEIHMNTFNKVWIVPQKANVFVNGNNVFVVDNYLKVMLEEDYLALETNLGHNKHDVGEISEDQAKEMSDASMQIIREVLIPEIEKEVNQGKNFSNLRQIFNSMILATWYKKNLKESLFGQVYVNQNKVAGIDLEDKDVKEKIYAQYVQAFEKGVFDLIKEDYDATTQEIIPRRYFSGGILGIDQAMLGGGEIDSERQRILNGSEFVVTVENKGVGDRAMINSPFPRLRVGTPFPVSTLFAILTTKYHVRNLLRDGPIRQPAFFAAVKRDDRDLEEVKAIKGVFPFQDKSYIPLFADPNDEKSFEEITDGILSGDIALPIIYKPNSLALGMGIFRVERSPKKVEEYLITLSYGEGASPFADQVAPFLSQFNGKAGVTIKINNKQNIMQVVIDSTTTAVKDALMSSWKIMSQQKFDIIPVYD